MPLTLEQYANYLDTRDLPWPAPPAVQPPRAKPHLVAMPEVRLVTWNIYGTLLAISTGNVLFEHPQKFVMDIALDKTVQEFKMWGSMSRKPGQPADYMREIYDRVIHEQKLAPSPGEKYPEILSEKIWEGIVKKLLQKDYKFDHGFYGSLNEFSRKIAYFFHASLQGTACYPGAAQALEQVQSLGLAQGLIADAQCFTLAQLQRGLAQDGATTTVDARFDRALRPVPRAGRQEALGTSVQAIAGRGRSARPDAEPSVARRLAHPAGPGAGEETRHAHRPVCRRQGSAPGYGRAAEEPRDQAGRAHHRAGTNRPDREFIEYGEGDPMPAAGGARPDRK